MSPARELLLGLAGAATHGREAAILGARDLWVDWPLHDVTIVAHGHVLTLRVTVDVFALGTPGAPIRVPLSAPACQAVADALRMQLVTPAISAAVWRAADVRLSPQPWGPPYDASMLSVERLLAHNDRIEERRGGLAGLIAGHKKDVAVTNRLAAQPDRVAICGWHRYDGTPIQPLSLAHEATYADYSHGLRFVATDAVLDGACIALCDVMGDPSLSRLVSDEGPLRVMRYPG